MFFALALLTLPAVITASSAHGLHKIKHEHISKRALPGTWYHAPDHPTHSLFKRGPSTDGLTYAEVGSPTWLAAFPVGAEDVSSKIPQAWVDALDKAVKAGKIPDIPKASVVGDGPITYPSGVNPADPKICARSAMCHIPGDTYNGPDGIFGTGFDDGPTPATPGLIEFLKQHNVVATHYMIGRAIRENPTAFLTAYNGGGDIAVHTYTHRPLNTLENNEILAELGWTMEIIHNSTGGRVPRYWRPPQGEYDHRVRAIAREVFGLEAVLWNQDTFDWRMSIGGQTLDKIHSSMTQWLSGPKSPGLIILEHELTADTVKAFQDAFPLIEKNGWKIKSQAQLVNTAYQNVDSAGKIVPGLVGMAVNASGTTAASSALPSSASSASSSEAPKKKNSAATTGPHTVSALIASAILTALGVFA